MKHQLQNLKPEEKTPEELLIEIRNLLSPQGQDLTHRHLTPNQIDEMLKDSYQQSQILKKMPSLKPITQQKIQEATPLLQQKYNSNFIHQYAKQKINSEMFSPLRSNISETEQEYYQRQREELLRQRELEEQEELERQRHVIETTKKFVKYEAKKLPYADINQLTLKQGNSSRTYLLNQAPEKTQSSINNKIDESMASDLEARYEEMRSSQMRIASSERLHQMSEDDFIEIMDEDENQNERAMKEQMENNLFEALKTCPRFVKVFKQILLNQLTLQKILGDENSSKYRSSLNRSESTFKYKNQPMLTMKKLTQPITESVASLTKKYRSKGIVLKQMGFRSNFKVSKVICQKIVNKMIGQSNDYHPKKAVLTENELSWCDEKQQIKEDSKKVELTIQNIRVEKKRKEEGSFFSKVASDIDVVMLEGNNRNITFEKNYLEGGQLYEQLCNLMAQRVYNLNIIIACKVNEQLNDFIINKKTAIFDLSNQFLQSHDKYPTRDYRLMIISIFSALFPFRNEVTRLNLTACRTNVEENNQIFKSLRFNKVQEIVISQTKFNADSLTLLTNYISTLASTKLEVTLCNCMIDDNILQRSKESFVKCTNIQKLNISLNNFTLQGFSVIHQLCIQEKTSITELNISENMITNLAVIGELLKKCKKLEVLIAQNCGFSFESDQEMKQFFLNSRNSRLKKLSLLRNELVNSLRCFEDFWVSDSPKQINVDLGIYTQKTSKNLQGKLL